MNSPKLSTLGAIFLSMTFASASKAAILANYDFATNASSIDTDAGSTASNYTSTYGSQSGYSTTAFNYFVRIQATPSTLVPTSYFTFTVTATAGNILNLTTLAFRSSLSANIPTFNGNVTVRSSVDNFAADLATYSQASTSGVSFTDRGPIDLSGSQFQNLAAVTFRFYLYDNSDDSTGNSFVHRIDDVVLNGDAVPEPSSLGLAAFAGMAFFSRRKR